MATLSSLTEEVLAAINMKNLTPIPSYLSETDAITVDTFMQSTYAREYMIDTSNIHWGGKIHHSHVFDIYSVYSPTKDPVKVRLDMLQFVSANKQRYSWNGHLYLRMSELNLDTWVQKMTFWDTCADALAIYALSDMLGIHTTVLTRSKPWTTIRGDYQGDVNNLLKISSVNLVYLGQNKFARLWKKAVPDSSSFRGPNFNYAPMMPNLAPPTADDLNTAQTLIELQGSDKKTSEETTPSIILEDTMDKIVGHTDDCPIGELKVQDAMDAIVEPQLHEQQTTLHVEMVTTTPQIGKPCALRVETKACSVKLIRLENILADDLCVVPPSTASDLPVGEHFTRSCSTPPIARVGRKPR